MGISLYSSKENTSQYIAEVTRDLLEENEVRLFNWR